MGTVLMRVIALFFFTISFFQVSWAETNYEYQGVCQIAEFESVDVSHLCTGEYIYSPTHMAVLIGVAGKEPFFSFIGKRDTHLYSEGRRLDLPRLIHVDRVRFAGRDIAVSRSSYCLIAATKRLDGQLVRCFARNKDRVYQVLFYSAQKL